MATRTREKTYKRPEGQMDPRGPEVMHMASSEGGEARRTGSLSGLTEEEAREFHRIFVASFAGFTAIAIVAHFLVWQWRPWLQ